MSEGGQWMTVVGDMIMLDMESGKVAVDSIAGNNPNVIELFGEAQYDAGHITGDALRVHVRDSKGAYMFGGDIASLDAIVVTGDSQSAIFGTVDATHANGFEMNGGLVLSKAN